MNNPSSFQPAFIRVFNFIMLGHAIFRLQSEIFAAWHSFHSMTSYGVTEFLINYQGGFVRRGLIGELLYHFSSLTNIDSRWIIVPFCYATFFLISFILLYGFKSKNLCWWLLPLNFSLLGLDLHRKDAFMILIAAMVLFAYTRIRKVPYKLLAVNIILIFGLNVHEAEFFIIGFFTTALILLDQSLKLSFWKRCIAVLPYICMMGCISMYHGNGETALAIFNSLAHLYPNDFVDFKHSTTICSLAASTIPMMGAHIKYNFLVADGFFVGYWVRPLVWCATFFLTARLPFILQELKQQTVRTDIHAYLSVIVFQWLVQSPLFTLLHADTSRALAYWVTSSLLIFIILPLDTIESALPMWYKRCITISQRIIYNPKAARALPFLTCVVAAPFFGMVWKYIFSRTVIGSYYYMMKTIVFYIMG